MKDFPGYLGFTSRGVIAIHADWPAYPLEHGWQTAVITLGSHPSGTQFTRVDDIDQCALFLAEGPRKYDDPYDERAFHVAIWHEDLLEAHALGLVSGVEPLGRRQYEERRREDLRAHLRRACELSGSPLPAGDLLTRLGMEVDGQFVHVEWPALDEYEDEDLGLLNSGRWLGIGGPGTVSLTAKGWARLDELWAEALEIPEQARPRLEVLIEHEFYDSALRELGALIETRMRELTSSRSYGLVLVEHFMAQLSSSERFHNAGLKILRSELRTALKFVRNEFAHKVVDLPRARAYALLGRMCRVLTEVYSAAEALARNSPLERFAANDGWAGKRRR